MVCGVMACVVSDTVWCVVHVPGYEVWCGVHGMRLAWGRGRTGLEGSDRTGREKREGKDVGEQSRALIFTLCIGAETSSYII